ncbi:MAG: APC family permease [Candidatus Eremiobacteraeota bacterium]|nr:APC family permease [Candidatus Eremiobacteraeota bacterium]
MTVAAPGLRAQCLNVWEVLAQSVAMLGPTMTPVLIVPLMYASAGNASWLAYAFGSLMLLAVALNIREFASRSSSSGSIYTYAERAFGVRGSLLCGWSLLWAYALVGVAGVTGFAVFANALLGAAAVHVTAFAPLVFCLALSFALAFRDIRLSTITLLLLEAGSVSLIVVLMALVLAHHGTLFDADQLSLRGSSLPGIGLGAVVAIFSLVGFESATSLGEEARDPLRTIPTAVIASVLVAGAFFVICAYAEVLGAHGLPTPLDKLGTPLDALADSVHAPLLKLAIDVGALLSSFSITLAALNAGARIVFSMARDGLFPASLARSHRRFATPHVALAVFSAICFVVGAGMLAAGLSPIDAFNDTATLGSFGFVAIYAFVALGAPLYLKQRGELRPHHVVVAVATLALLVIPAVGSVYPVPPPPSNYFPYAFAAYMAIGAAFLWRRGPTGQVPLGAPR